MRFLQGYYLLFMTIAQTGFSCGQSCGEDALDLVITGVDERSLQLYWTEDSPPYRVEIEPQPCEEHVNYGCQCKEDSALNLTQSSNDNTYTVTNLFPGRLYIFDVYNNTDDMIATNCSYTAPRTPTLFKFDETETINPTVNAIGVVLQMPWTADSSCNPDQYTEFSNSYIWSAENVEDSSPHSGNIDDPYEENGIFRFIIASSTFSAGQEYTLSIQSRSGNLKSIVFKYQDNDGKFKTAVPDVVGVEVLFNSLLEPLRLVWIRAAIPFVRSEVYCYTSHASDHIFNRTTVLDSLLLHDFKAGYEHICTVETYYPGYRQETDPIPVPFLMRPIQPKDVIILNTSISEVLLSWSPPEAYRNLEYLYNISVTGTPCDTPAPCSCGCAEYGNGIFTSSQPEIIISNLYSGRKYTFDVMTVSDGPIPSHPADGDKFAHTVPRPPDISFDAVKSTNTSIQLVITRSAECSNGSEVEDYILHTNDTQNEWWNATIQCSSDDENLDHKIGDLNPGEEYRTCIYSIIEDLTSDTVCSDLTKTKINAPAISTPTIDGDSTIFVTWDAVKGIESYAGSCESDEGDTKELDINGTSGTCEGLTSGALYTVKVDSIKEGYQQYDDLGQNRNSLRLPPINPAFDVSVLNTTHVCISWTVTGYLDVIKYQVGSGLAEEMPAEKEGVAIIDNLEPNEMYDIHMWGIAGTDGQDDLETENYTVNVQTYSLEVENITINPINGTTIEIMWNDPSGNADDTELHNYLLQLWEGEICIRTVIMDNTNLPVLDDIEGSCGSITNENYTGSSVEITLFNLEPCTSYSVTVIPVNTAGNSNGASDMTETEIVGPMEPVKVDTTDLTATTLKISWEKPEPLNCPMSSNITLTYIYCETGLPGMVERSFDDEYEDIFSGLQPFTDHNITIKVFNEEGLESAFAPIKTLSSEPGPPRDLKNFDLEHDTVTIGWEPVEPCKENGIIINYVLTVCSTDILTPGAEENCKDDVLIEPGKTTYQVGDLNPYFSHRCILKARNEYGDITKDGQNEITEFDTKMWFPDTPAVTASPGENCEGFTITVKHNKLNGPLVGYEIEMSKEGATDEAVWKCTGENCNKDDSGTITLTQEQFPGIGVLKQGDTFIIEAVIENEFDKSEKGKANLEFTNCQTGTETDAGLIAGLSILFIVIIAALVGLVIYARKKRIGPFSDSDPGFNYLDGQSMEAVPVGGGDTPNNHTDAGTANAAYIKEDDSETVESSSPIQIDQFEAYCNDAYGDSQYKMAEQFGVIKQQSPVHEGIECRRPENKPKNRYTNILPFDWSLVKLKTRIGVPFSEYINATYIPGEWGKDEYIATQGPVTETIDDFWRMVWEQETPIVIMLTVFVQNNKAKCVMYWPEAGSTMVCGDILVTTKSSDSWGFDDQYRTREIHLKCNDQVRVITQYQMVEWPDYGCPDSPDELLDLVETVRLQCPDDRMTRLVVHCSAGVGRTGTYIAVDRLRQQLDKKEPTDTIDIQAMISEMREYRPHMVQTEAQYTYIHDCVNAMLLRKHGQNVDNGEVDIYENTDYPRKVSAESTDSDNPTMSGAMPYPIKVSADSTDSDKPTMSGTMSMSVIV